MQIACTRVQGARFRTAGRQGKGRGVPRGCSSPAKGSAMGTPPSGMKQREK